MAAAHRTAPSHHRVCTGRKNPLSMLWFVPTTQIIQIPRGAIRVRGAPFLLRTRPRPTCLASRTYQSNRKIPLSREEKKQTSQSSCSTPETPQTTPNFLTLPPGAHPRASQICTLRGERAFTGRCPERDNRKSPRCFKTLNC